MNKAELVSAISKRADVPASTVDSVIDALGKEFVDALTNGEKIAIPGLLTLERSARSARTRSAVPGGQPALTARCSVVSTM